MKNEIDCSELLHIALQYTISLFLQTATSLGQIKSPFHARLFTPIEDTYTRIAWVTRSRGLPLPPEAIEAMWPPWKLQMLRLMCVPQSIPVSQIFKNKRNHFLTSKKCFKTLKNEVLQELVLCLILQNTLRGWSGDYRSKTRGLLCNGRDCR